MNFSTYDSTVGQTDETQSHVKTTDRHKRPHKNRYRDIIALHNNINNNIHISILS